MSEFYYLQQMMKGMSATMQYPWISIALFLVLAGFCLLRPDRVRLPGLFRWSSSLFAISIIVSALEPSLLQYLEIPFSPARRGSMQVSPDIRLVVTAVGMIQPLLLASSIYCLFASVAPPKVVASQPGPVESKPHPLD